MINPPDLKDPVNPKSKYFKETIEIADALQSLRPNASFGVANNDVDQINWQSDPATRPDRQEILDEQARLQSLRDAEIYKKQRAFAYPSIEQQLDYIYHHGIDAWKSDLIDPVKAQFPKSSE